MSDHADDAAWFRQMLEDLEHTQASFARWLAENGDIRPPVTIARGVRRMANGEAKVPGEVRVLMTLLRHQHPGRTEHPMTTSRVVRELHKIWHDEGIMPGSEKDTDKANLMAASYLRLSSTLLWIIDEASPQADDLPQRMREIREAAHTALDAAAKSAAARQS